MFYNNSIIPNSKIKWLHISSTLKNVHFYFPLFEHFYIDIYNSQGSQTQWGTIGSCERLCTFVGAVAVRCALQNTWILIYIPLCIYFNIIFNNIPRALVVIYIPLCIYFNFYSPVLITDRMVFTFHYVSISTSNRINDFQFVGHIYIPLCTYFNYQTQNRSHMKHWFTFHYVSISTWTGYRAWIRLLYLHSTMYLFQLEVSHGQPEP